MILRLLVIAVVLFVLYRLAGGALDGTTAALRNSFGWMFP